LKRHGETATLGVVFRLATIKDEAAGLARLPFRDMQKGELGIMNDLRQLIVSNALLKMAAKNHAGSDERAIREAMDTERNQRRGKSPSRAIWYVRGALLASVFALTLLLAGQGFASGAHTGFGFNGGVSGPTGAVFLSGGGSFKQGSSEETNFVKAGGGFRCTEPVTQGLLAGCAAGEGVRWDAEELLTSSGFKCIGNESAKTAFTGDGVVVMQADFYRAGDGNEASFSAKMFVSDHDLDQDVDGVQNVWIQGIGCGPAVVNFSS
jgi:hypothetical protein